ncbi:hypothetical protein RISK_004386 [Rhodopirellula islandica]|uniref:Uncharacterized protein n=1 Tax=Rhodopirellula islandica TaxID=595434 RepID=A0A0J1BA40_RHOIS|nr:hypothetical protein RISK_004386 [Rhodopirellula islandica]
MKKEPRQATPQELHHEAIRIEQIDRDDDPGNLDDADLTGPR